MFEYAQRATSQEYRDNWDRIWGSKENSPRKNAWSENCDCGCHYLYDECCIECKVKSSPHQDDDGLTWEDYGYSEVTGCTSDSGHHCSCWDEKYQCCICEKIPEKGEL